MGAYAAAYAVVSAIVLVLLTVMPGASYTSWGWRIPFVAGGCIGFVFLAYRARIPESGMWQATVKETNPLRTVLRGRVRRDLAQVLVLMTGLWLVATSVVTVMPRILATELGMSSRWVTAVLLVSQGFVFAGFVTIGVLSQVWGRRRVLIRGAAVAGTAGLASYGLVLTHEAGATMLVVLVVLTQLLVLSVWGAVMSYCNERFETAVRSSGFGVACSLGVVPASFYAFYMAGLGRMMPFELTQLVLLVVGAGLTVIGARRGPETVSVHLDRVTTTSPPLSAEETSAGRA